MGLLSDWSYEIFGKKLCICKYQRQDITSYLKNSLCICKYQGQDATSFPKNSGIPNSCQEF